jgi:hypothetical protein
MLKDRLKKSSKEIGMLRGRLLDQIHDDPEMTPADQSVCYGLARSIWKDGTARVSNADLVDMTHRDLRTVERGIKKAVMRGHFTIESKCRGDRLFVPSIKEKSTGENPVRKPKTRPAKIRFVDGDSRRSRPVEHPPKVPAAEGPLEPPSLELSLNSHRAGPSGTAATASKVEGEEFERQLARVIKEYPRRNVPFTELSVRNALTEAIDKGADPETLIACVKEYAAKEHRNVGTRFIMHPVKFLGGEWTAYEPPKPSTIKRGPFAETYSDLWREWHRYEKTVGHIGGALDLCLFPDGRHKGSRQGCYVDLQWAAQQSPELLAACTAPARRAPDHAAARKAAELIRNCTQVIDQQAA